MANKLTRDQLLDAIIQVTGYRTRDLTIIVQKGQEELSRRAAMAALKAKNGEREDSDG
jgi:hypothetical protein